jgi:hypothetical protein
MKSTEAMALSSGSTNVSETDKKNSSSELIKRNRIANTPFVAIKTDEGGWFLTMGKYRVSEEYETEEEVIKLVKTKDWELLMNIMTVVTESLGELRNELTK